MPELSVGSYYTASVGAGIPLEAGDLRTESKNIFINYKNNYTGFDQIRISCSNESSFRVEIIELTIFEDIASCGSCTIPNLTFGEYYSNPQGTVTIISARTALTES